MPSRSHCRKPRILRSLASAAIETLESRTLLNATMTSAIGTVTSTENANATTIDLTQHFKDPTITGTAVVMHTSQGDIPLNLFQSQTPQTVANFKSYVESGAYDNTVIHRAIPGFLIQGGSYLPDQTPSPPPPNQRFRARFRARRAFPIRWERSLRHSQGAGYGHQRLVHQPRQQQHQRWMDARWRAVHCLRTGDLQRHEGRGEPDRQPSQGDCSAYVYPDTVNLGDPSTGVLPLQNYNGGTITPANYVTITSIQEVPSGLAFAATSSNTSLVVPTISDGTLSLNYQPNQTGIASITVTATDLGGNAVSQTFEVAVGSALGPERQADPLHRCRWHADDADAHGPRQCQRDVQWKRHHRIAFQGRRVDRQRLGTFDCRISLTGTSAASTLNATGVGGNGLVEIGSITSDGNCERSTPRACLSGDLTIAGTVSRVALNSATGGTITLSGTGGSATLAIPTATAKRLLLRSHCGCSVHVLGGRQWRGVGPILRAFHQPIHRDARTERGFGWRRCQAL